MMNKLLPRHAFQNKHWRKVLLLPLALAFVLTPLLALQPTPTVADQGAPGWHIETVDGEGDVGKYSSLALDEDGYPHISYFDDDPYYDLKYAYQDDSGWHIETVDSEGVVGWYISLALDENGYPHISYYDRSNCGLKYAYQDASGWHTETVERGDSVHDMYIGHHTSLALDEDGYPHISYQYSRPHYDLRYAYQDASGWHIEIVDSVEIAGYYTSLALDESGYPHISYSTMYGENLKYAYQDASGWHIETVDSEGNVGYYSSLALDGNGYPHISYRDSTNRDLKYAYQDVFGWHIATVDSEEQDGAYTSLSLDGNGYPHVSYLDPRTLFIPWDASDLKYAYQDTSGWHIETVDSEGNVGWYTSLALDGDGHPRISYWGNGDLKYAYYQPYYHVYLPTILKE